MSLETTKHPQISVGVEVVEHNGTLTTALLDIKRLTTFSQKGLTGVQVINIEFSPDNGTTWVQAKNGGEDIALSDDDRQAVIIAPGKYRLVSTDTLVNTTVGMDTI